MDNANKKSLRKRAEERLQKRLPRTDDLSPEQVKTLVHDYHVHQIELELQNEELRDAHEQLQKTRDRFAGLFNHAPVGYLIIDQNGVINHSNQTFADMVDLEPHHLSGRPLANFLILQDISAFHGRFKAFFKNPAGKQLDFKLRGKNDVITVRCTGRKETTDHARQDKKEAQGLLLAVNDITEQAQSQEALKASEERFRSLIENMAEGIVLKDSSDRYVHWNQTASDLFGFGLDEVRGKTTQNFKRKIIREDGSDFPVNELPSLITLRTGEPCRNVTMGIARGSQDVVWVKVNSIPHFKAGGKKIDSVIISFSDITERKKAEQALRFERAQLFSIFDSISEMIYVCDPDTYEILFVNKYMKDLFSKELTGGICYQELRNQNSPCDFCAVDRLLKESEGPVRRELFNPVLNKHLITTDRIIKWPDGRDVKFQMAVDISSLKQAKNELSQANQQLQKTLAEQDVFFSIIAHDLKSPMSGILNLSTMLAQELSSFSEEDLQHITSELSKSTKGVYALLQDLLQWSRLRRDNVEFTPETYNLRDLVIMSLETTKNASRQKEVSLENDIPPGLRVYVDQSMINTVFRNLIFNAVKFTYRGGKININAGKADSFIEVRVQDNGMGMDGKTLDGLFSVDKKSRGLGTEGEKGTGLGLVLCREFVEKHGGRIWAESKPEQGTAICFSLPAAD